MKLRLDLLGRLTDEDILEEALANTHRYNPEPLFAETGVGSLRPATPEEREQELVRIEALAQRLEERAKLAEARKSEASRAAKTEHAP